MEVAGAIICESLKPGTVLEVEGMVVTRWSRYAVEARAEYQPAVWTLIEFEAPEAVSDRLAQEVADALLEPGWYANWNSETQAVIVFPHTIFRYAHGDLEARSRAKEHGRRCGVPEPQLDWKD